MENLFGNVVQRHRERAGLTQDDLAKVLEVSQQTVAKWESGRAYPRPAAFAKLNAILRIPAQEIMESYSKSKGAKSPNLYPPLILQQMEWAEGATARSVVKESGFPQLAVNPYAPQDLRKEILSSLMPVLDAARPGAKWSENVKSGTISWRVDYADNEVVADFKYAESPAMLKKILSNEARLALWNLTTLRASLRDKRHYLLIIMMPGNVRVDYEEGDPEWDDLEILTNERTLRRLNAEAAPLDLSIFVANTARQVLALINLHAGGAAEIN